jgi:hypothetical protein
MAAEAISPELDAFLNDAVRPEAFHHADHVRVAFDILRRCDFPEAALTYSAGIKRIAARAGDPGAYHETITIAFLSLISERSAAAPYRDYAAFAKANGDLLDKSALAKWYAPERLASAIARKTFILPGARR